MLKTTNYYRNEYQNHNDEITTAYPLGIPKEQKITSVGEDMEKLEPLCTVGGENNQRYTMWEIADLLKISKSSAENHLPQLGYVNCFDVWVPHNLSGKNFLDCISTSDSLLKCNENVPFLKQIVTGDEKWTLQ